MKFVKRISIFALLLMGILCLFCKQSKVSAASTTYNLVNDASTLKAGDILVFGCSSKGKVSSAISGKYFSAVDATIANGVLTPATGAVVGEITLGGEVGAWTLTASEGLIGTSAAKALTTNGKGTTTWTIAIDENGLATVASTNTDTDCGRFLYNAGAPRFLNYTSATNASMLLPEIYRKAEVAEDDLVKTFAADVLYSSKLCFNYEENGEEYLVSNMLLRVAVVLDKTLYDALVKKNAVIGVSLTANTTVDYLFNASNAVTEGDKVYFTIALEVPVDKFATDAIFKAFVKINDAKTEAAKNLTTSVKMVASKYLEDTTNPAVSTHSGVLTFLAK